MSLRRILAEIIDPEVRDEVYELREAACNAVVSRGIADIRLVETKVQLVVAMNERDQARADVARLLEDAARCASENHTTPEK